MQPTALPRDERGIALPTAIFALVVIGALVAGIFFTARIEVRSGENTMSNARATEAAQAGLMMGYPQVLSISSAFTANGQKGGLVKTQIGTTGSYYADTVTQLNRYMYLLRSFGSYEVNGTAVASRTLAMLIKKYVPELGVNSGAIVVGNATVSGSADLNGHDQTPPGWTGCPAGTDQPGLRTNGTASGNKLGSVTGSGTPPYTQGDTTVTGMARVMDTLFFQLANQANYTITTSTASATVQTSGSTCTKNSTNWGDPLRTNSNHSCETYFPIIYLNPGGPGNTVTVHADGQGVLLVNGDLRFNSNNNYAGLIIVRGAFQGGTGTANIEGSLISANVNLDPANFNGNLTIDYSSCAVTTALKNLAVTAPSTYRGFIQY